MTKWAGHMYSIDNLNEKKEFKNYNKTKQKHMNSGATSSSLTELQLECLDKSRVKKKITRNDGSKFFKPDEIINRYSKNLNKPQT